MASICSHYMVGVPQYFVVVEGGRRIEPQAGPLLSVPLPVGEHIRLKGDGLPFQIAQELEVQLVVAAPTRRQLQTSLKYPHHEEKMFRNVAFEKRLGSVWKLLFVVISFFCRASSLGLKRSYQTESKEKLYIESSYNSCRVPSW